MACQCGSNCSTPSCRSCSGSGNCQWSCDGCDGGCTGSCSGSCTGCKGSCSGSCTGSCSGGCSGGCKDSCKNACNQGCSNNEATSLANLTLTTKFAASNITNIARLIYIEAQRRSKSPASTSFTAGKKITAADITTLISNLSLAGQTTSYSASKGSKGLKTLGQDLINKAKAAYNTTIKLP